MDGEDAPEQDDGLSAAFWELKMVVQDESLSLDERRGAVKQLEELARRRCTKDTKETRGLIRFDDALIIQQVDWAQERLCRNSLFLDSVVSGGYY